MAQAKRQATVCLRTEHDPVDDPGRGDARRGLFSRADVSDVPEHVPASGRPRRRSVEPRVTLGTDLRAPLSSGGHGIHEYSFAWARWLQSEGYAALVVDSLGSRAPGEPRIWGGARGVSLNEMAADAYGAMAYLRSLTFIEGDRIAVMGWSQGGAAAFIAVNPGGRPMLALPHGPGLRAMIGIYPICDSLAMDTHVPILLLLGGEDPYTHRCAQDVARMREQGKPVTAKTYARAKHGFDQEPWIEVYDRAATADAREQVHDFLRQHLTAR